MMEALEETKSEDQKLIFFEEKAVFFMITVYTTYAHFLFRCYQRSAAVFKKK